MLQIVFFKDLLTEIDTNETSLSARAEQVSGRLNELDKKEFDERLRNFGEEWQKAKQRLTEQRELLEDGISSCMKQLEVMERAKTTAKEVDQLLNEIDDSKQSDMEAVESKTEVLCVYNCNVLIML